MDVELMIFHFFNKTGETKKKFFRNTSTIFLRQQDQQVNAELNELSKLVSSVAKKFEKKVTKFEKPQKIELVESGT